MNFSAFQDLRRKLLAERPELVDAAETNLYRSLQRLMPQAAPAVNGPAHRCHLASQWVGYYGLPAEASRRAVVSRGVRDSLGTLFAHWATSGQQLWLPDDNYPVYHELAAAAGLAVRTFSTLPDPVWPDPEAGDGDALLLVTNPLKPRGRWLDASDVAALRRWLAADSRRRVVLDVVYSLDGALHATIHDLLGTDQVIVLHSLTKGWLRPRLFGVALVPEQDSAVWMPIFRAQAPPQENLVAARNLMTSYADTPGKVAAALDDARRALLSKLPDLLGASLPTDTPGYFFVVSTSWQNLLDRGVLGLPASVFGSKREDFTILSSLRFAL